jgi:ATP-dependent DNA helicase RecG
MGIEENPEALDELRQLLPVRIVPAPPRLTFHSVECRVRADSGTIEPRKVVCISVHPSQAVCSIAGGGTFSRLDASNRQMSAAEIVDLSYRRGVRSAAAEPVNVPLDLLATDVWRQFVEGRGLHSGDMEDQLLRTGLAVRTDGDVYPTRAAVLLFADEPGGLLQAHNTRADIRVLVYDGKVAAKSATPNLRKAEKTVRGPLVRQIDNAVRIVLDELSQGVVLSGSGFKAHHVYPDRVVKEAIVNAVIHRDYRLNRDIFIRIFDDHLEIENPGSFVGSITVANISKSGSLARNPLLASCLREFPTPPNIDAGEGVRMMFAEMANADLYPPVFRSDRESEVDTITLTLLNHKRPDIWDEVSDFLDRHGSIANADVVRISGRDTLKASKMLSSWRDQGLLTAIPGRGKRNMAYTRPFADGDKVFLFSLPQGE